MVRSGLVLALGAVLLSAAAASAQTSVSGRVSNAQGGVIANAEATLRALPPPGTPPMPNMPNMPAPFERTATAGADGAFTLNGIPAGDYVLFVDASGFERSSQTITVGNQAQNLMVTLTPLILPGAEESAGAGARARIRRSSRTSSPKRFFPSRKPASSVLRCTSIRMACRPTSRRQARRRK